MWAHIWFVPILLLWVSHWMVCLNCRFSTKLSWRTVLPGVRARRLVIEKARPGFEAERLERVDAFGRMPDAHQTFDALTINPGRSMVDVAIVAFLLGYVALIGLIVYAAVVH
jgi:hypothetical protein